MDPSAGPPPATDRFRGLILVLRGRAGLTQRALAAQLGISEQAIRKWEGGEGYSSPARLRALIALYLARGVFTAGREEEGARALWEALRREAAHRTPPSTPPGSPACAPPRPRSPSPPPPVPAGVSTTMPERGQWQAWGEAPDIAGFQGREAEVETLRRWLVEERCRLVAVLGLGGIGKTAPATHTARQLVPHFEGLCWRSLHNAPPARGVGGRRRCGRGGATVGGRGLAAANHPAGARGRDLGCGALAGRADGGNRRR